MDHLASYFDVQLKILLLQQIRNYIVTINKIDAIATFIELEKLDPH
jgi:hypothetical protein